VVSGLISGVPKAAGVYPIQIAALNESGVACSLVTLTVK